MGYPDVSFTAQLFSAVFATIAIAVTATVASPAAAAVPGQPTSVTARAGDQLAEVTWNAPTPDDPTITGYLVTASPADTPAVTVDPTARTAMVTGLTNGTAYTFTVAAINPDGTGPPSDPSAPITPVPPAATMRRPSGAPPASVTAGSWAAARRRCSLSWRAGLSRRGRRPSAQASRAACLLRARAEGA